MKALHFRIDGYEHPTFQTGSLTRQHTLVTAVLNPGSNICLSPEKREKLQKVENYLIDPKADPTRASGQFVLKKEKFLSPELILKLKAFRFLSPTDRFYWIYRWDAESQKIKTSIFERIRQEVNSNLPSRERAFYAALSHVNKKILFKKMGFGPEYKYCYQVELEGGKLHRASLSLLDCNYSSFEEIEKKAEEYWTTSPTDSNDTEILFEGTIKFLKLRK
jgi:hypothetical protein